MQMDSTAPRPLRVVGKGSRILALRARNRASRAPVTGPAPVTLSLTSYGERMAVVGHTIESLAAGRLRPRRMVLWVDDPERAVQEHPMLGRLRARGLEILPTADYKPHKKYYSLLESEGPSDTPIVAADDDILYPTTWLEGLVREHVQRPEHFLGYRAHWIRTTKDGLLPYSDWDQAPVGAESPRTFITTGAGSVYPRALQEALLLHGTVFQELSPRADDVWVNAVAVAAGVPKRRVAIDHLGTFYTYPRTQGGGLHAMNVGTGGNDVQIRAAHDHLGLHASAYGDDLTAGRGRA